jgi:hypothetical protein
MRRRTSLQSRRERNYIHRASRYTRDIQVLKLSGGGRVAAGGIAFTAILLLIASRLDWQLGLPTSDAAKKYVVSRTMDRVDWNAELVRGDLGKAVQQLERESGKGLLVGGVKLPLALAELGLIDEYEFLVQPSLAATGRRCSRGYRSVST